MKRTAHMSEIASGALVAEVQRLQVARRSAEQETGARRCLRSSSLSSNVLAAIRPAHWRVPRWCSGYH